MFPPRLAHYFISSLSEPDDLVVDPFSGRGTTTLQARIEGRRSIGNDLSPLGYVLSAAKANPPEWEDVLKSLANIEKRYKRGNQPESDVSRDIQMLFHEHTLQQLVFIRSELMSRPIESWSPTQLMIAGTMAGILHGGHRADGTSAYLSISMPNTFSMSPDYVRRYIRDNGLKRIDQNVFERLRDKLARVYMDATPGTPGVTFQIDAPNLLTSSAIRAGSADLVLTSPPYLGVVNYGTSNWIRLWWLGVDDVGRERGSGRRSLDEVLDHRHTYSSYREFMSKILAGVRRILKPTGTAVVVIGDVASPDRPSYDLADRIWSDLGEQSGLTLVDRIEDSVVSQSKVSRIWGDTKGQATDRDCILILGRKDGKPTRAVSGVDWDEPYKDGGPDAAHRRLQRRRTEP
jgi:site-specific DNA-methyltransferase (adenine-specific)